MSWFFTALLIVASAGTVGFACYLLRRLFTTEAVAVDVAGPLDVPGATAVAGAVDVAGGPQS